MRSGEREMDMGLEWVLMFKISRFKEEEEEEKTPQIKEEGR